MATGRMSSIHFKVADFFQCSGKESREYLSGTFRVFEAGVGTEAQKKNKVRPIIRRGSQKHLINSKS